MNSTLTWEVARERHADALALAERERHAEALRRHRRSLRGVLGFALVGLGTRLAASDEYELAVVSVPRAWCRDC